MQHFKIRFSLSTTYLLFLVALVFFVSIFITAEGFNQSQETVPDEDTPAFKTLAQCTQDNKYLFVLFFEDKNESRTQQMIKIFNKAKTTFKEKAVFTEINMVDKIEEEFIKQFEVDKVAKPIILSIAPGGIVTQQFIEKVELKELEEAFVTPKTLELLKATQDNKYLFVLFFKDEKDSNTRKMTEVFNKAEATLSEKAVFIEINVADKAEEKFIKRFEVNKVAKPLILSIAPGGIVTRGFIRRVKLEELEQAFVTPKTLEVLKAAQERKLIILVFNNDKLEDSKQAQAIINSAVKEFSNQFPIQAITVDPLDEAEKDLLKQVDISPDINKAAVAVMQNGALKGTIKPGKLTAKALKDLINKSCGPGCGPAG